MEQIAQIIAELAQKYNMEDSDIKALSDAIDAAFGTPNQGENG